MTTKTVQEILNRLEIVLGRNALLAMVRAEFRILEEALEDAIREIEDLSRDATPSAEWPWSASGEAPSAHMGGGGSGAWSFAPGTGDVMPECIHKVPLDTDCADCAKDQEKIKNISFPPTYTHFDPNITYSFGSVKDSDIDWDFISASTENIKRRNEMPIEKLAQIRLEVVRMILNRDPHMPWAKLMTEANRIMQFIEQGKM